MKMKWEVRFRNEVEPFGETDAFEFPGDEPEDVRKDRDMMTVALQHMYPDAAPGDIKLHLANAE